MNVLDLFSGIGGFSLGLERAGMRTVAFCEIEPFCRRVLAKHWPDVPVYRDIRELSVERFRADGLVANSENLRGQALQRQQPDGDVRGDGAVEYATGIGRGEGRQGHEIQVGFDQAPAEPSSVDLICGGFPCQPWSLAGQQRGHDDDRDLWPEMRRVVGEFRPRWVLGENVPGLDGEHLALDGVLADLEALGYEATTFEIPACAVDAPHRRQRLWIVAHHAERARGDGERQDATTRRPQRTPGGLGGGDDVAHRERAGLEERPSLGRDNGAERAAVERGGSLDDATGSRSQTRLCRSPLESRPTRRREELERRSSSDGHWDDAEWLRGHDGKLRRIAPGVRLLAPGIPERVAKLRALGNAVVPQVVERIGRAIMEAA